MQASDLRGIVLQQRQVVTTPRHRCIEAKLTVVGHKRAVVVATLDVEQRSEIGQCIVCC